MNKLIRCLAILTASALLTTSLLSCGGAGGSISVGGNDNPTEQGGSQNGNSNGNGNSDGSTDQRYDGLTPEGVYQALLQADDFTAIVTMHRTIYGESATGTLKMEKDGNLFRLGETYQSADESETDTTYYDLNTRYWYEQSDEEWIYVTEDFTLQSLLENLTQDSVGLLFEDDHYHPYNAVAGYLAKTESLKKFFENGPEGAAYTMSMTPSEEGYTYLLSIIATDQSLTMELKVSFSAVSVDLPDAEPLPSTGESNKEDSKNPVNPDENGSATPDNTDPSPDHKEEGKEEGTVAPQPSPSPSPVAGFLSPSDLYKAVYSAEELALDVLIGDNGYSVEKTGDLALVTRIANGEAVSSIYYDLESGYSYNYLNDRWNENYAAYDWPSLLQQLELTSSAYLFRDGYFESFENTDATLSVEDKLLQDSDIASATWKRTDGIYVFTETDTAGNTVSYVFRLNEDTDVVLPDMN